MNKTWKRVAVRQPRVESINPGLANRFWRGCGVQCGCRYCVWVHDFGFSPRGLKMLGKGHDVVESVMQIVNEISGIGEYRRNVVKKECANLTRRVKLLVPMIEEVKEMKDPLPEEAVSCFALLETALRSAKELLKFCQESSKLCLVLQREQVANKFHEVRAQLEQALNGLCYEQLEISDEVREEVELVHAQLRRAKGQADAPDLELYTDLSILLSQRSDKDVDPSVLGRLAEKLQLKTIADLKQESHALHTMVIENDGDPGETVEQMSAVFRRLKDFVLTENPEMETAHHEKDFSPGGASIKKSSSPVIPDDFRCPISLELMNDPVIVATGQTYERSCIQKWLDAGHRTCPKTQQTLPHTVLTPNYVLRSLIAQWCEIHGIELPKRSSCSRSGNAGGSMSEMSGDRAIVDILLQKLCSRIPEEQRAAAGELRLLAKRNADNRIFIAEAGAIPMLVNLLSTPDPRTQEHAVTALLNLSIYENNKGSIVMAGAIIPIVEVLKSGSMEARENAAATLFSLSVIDENKITIGASGAIPALVGLLCEGSPRGKKDAATALFNLSIYQGNKARAVRAGVVAPLMKLLADPSAGMVDEALAILAILASHQEGKVAIGNADSIPVLVDLIRAGTPRNRENAAAVLLALSTNDPQHLIAAQSLGAYEPLSDLAQNGTARAKRKAASLLEHMSKPE